jgi:hypothetical protein
VSGDCYWRTQQAETYFAGSCGLVLLIALSRMAAEKLHTMQGWGTSCWPARLGTVRK